MARPKMQKHEKREIEKARAQTYDGDLSWPPRMEYSPSLAPAMQ